MDTNPRRDTRPLPTQPGWVQRYSNRRTLVAIGVVSLLLLIIAVLGFYFLARRPTIPYPPDQPPPTSLGDLVTEYPELASVLQDTELDSVYKEFLLAYEQGGPDAAYELAKQRGLLNANDELRLTLELDTTDNDLLIQQLEEKGIKVTAESGNLLDVVIPLELLNGILETGDAASFLEGITELEHVQRVRMPYIPDQYSSNWIDRRVETESLELIGANAWQAAGFTGKGVKVGILDLTFDRYKELLGTDLPENVTVASFIAGVEADQTGDVHGTACAEIIHDIAPDAELYLAAFQTDVEYRQAIDWLISQGVDVISNSTGAVIGPMDGTGEDALLVDQVVQQGIFWVASAGNEANKHYRGEFTDTDGDGWHEFAPGKEFLAYATYGRARVALNWNAWGEGDENFDLYIYDKEGNELARSEFIQDEPGDWPAELIIYDYGEEEGIYYAGFYAKQISHPSIFDLYVYGLVDPDYATPDHSLNTPADARLAFTVGATNWETDELEEYSSQGPTNDGRIKPDITGPVDVSSAAYGETWDGTSAATPHVAGAAALVVQAFPDFTVQQVKDFLLDRAVDLGSSGPDNSFGYGRLWLGEPPSLTSLVPTPTEELGVPLPEVTDTTTPTEKATEETIKEATDTPELIVEEEGPSIGSLEALMIMGCIAIPGLLGLGGIALVAGVWYFSRSRQPPRPPAVPLARPPKGPPAGPPLQPSLVKAEDTCPRCGGDLRPQARFCPTCGLAVGLDVSAVPEEPVKKRCHYCGQPLRPNTNFCPRCGQPQ